MDQQFLNITQNLVEETSFHGNLLIPINDRHVSKISYANLPIDYRHFCGAA
jgi:hypothetical protein